MSALPPDVEAADRLMRVILPDAVLEAAAVILIVLSVAVITYILLTRRF